MRDFDHFCRAVVLFRGRCRGQEMHPHAGFRAAAGGPQTLNHGSERVIASELPAVKLDFF